MRRRARRLAVRRHRQRGQGVPRRRAGQGRAVLRRAELEVHALAPAPNGGLYVGTLARRQDLQGRSQRQRRRRSSIRTTSTSGRWRSTRKGNLYAGTGEKGVVYKITPDGKGAPFYQTKATHATALAFDKSRQPARRHRVARPRAARRRRRQGVRPARFAVPGNPRAALRRQGHAVRRRASAAAPAAAARAVAADDRLRSRRRPTPSRAPVAVGHRPRSRRSRSSTSAAAARQPASPREDRRAPKGAVYRIAPDGLWDQLWESRDDSPYDLTFDAEGRADRRHRQQGQDLPARRRSAAADAARARRRAAGDGVPQGRRAAGCTTRPPIPASCSGCRRSARRAGTYESEPRDAQMVSTWGAISWRGDDAGSGSRIEVFTRSGNTETPDDTWSAWSSAYTNADGLADHQPEGALPAVARGADRQGRRPGADVGHRRVPAAQPSPAGAIDHGPSAGHRVPEAVQRPATRISPGFDNQIDAGPQARAAAARTRSSRRQLAVARPPHVSEGAADAGLAGRRRERRRPGRTTCCTAAKARRPGRRCGRRRHRADPRLGHDDGAQRHVLRQDRRLGCAVERRRAPRWPASSTARRSRSTTRAPAIAVEQRARRRRPDDRHLRRQGRPLADPARGVLAGRPALARRVSGRRHRRLEATSTTSWRSTASSATAGLTLRATDAMNNVATAQVDAPSRRR